MDFSHKASQESVAQMIAALAKNQITAELVASSEAAKNRLLELVPEGAEVFTMTSVTLEATGVLPIFNESGRYTSVRVKLLAMDRKTRNREMQRLGASPDYAVGSVHAAIASTGSLLIASNTGSQLPAYLGGAEKVIFVVGTQKIVPDLDTAMKRLYEYTLPLESERAKKAYGVPGSNVSKIAIIHKEVVPGRIHVIFVDEAVGF